MEVGEWISEKLHSTLRRGAYWVVPVEKVGNLVGAVGRLFMHACAYGFRRCWHDYGLYNGKKVQ